MDSSDASLRDDVSSNEGKDLRRLNHKEALEVTLEMFRMHGRMTTKQVEDEIRRQRLECPDAPVRLLMRWNRQGLIKMEIGENYLPIWWVE